MRKQRRRSAEAVLTCTHNQCMSKNKKNIKKIHLKMNIYTAVKYCCILHGHVCNVFLEFLGMAQTGHHLSCVIRTLG